MTCSRNVIPSLVETSVREQLYEFQQTTSSLSSDTVVPKRMQLPPTMVSDSTNIRDSTMVEIEIKQRIHAPEITTNGSHDMETVVKEVDVLRGREMIRRHSGPHGSICYVVRRPGCCLCREQAWTLTMLAAHPDSPLKGFGMFGVVKETGVDNQGLAEFGTKFFPFPLYCDKSYTFYQALGDRRISSHLTSLFNPMSVFHFLNEAYRRITAKEIGGNLKGEGVVQGGIILFDKDGNPKYAYQEETGADVPIADLLLAVEALKREMLEESHDTGLVVED